MQLSWAILLLGASAVLAAPADDVMAGEVTTKAGRVRGVTKTNEQGVQHTEFLGIPYAKPPTGRRRFSCPEPVEAWTGTRDASQYGASCPQIAFDEAQQSEKMDEDCLFLNVFVPQSASRERPLPVMVFIHGGGFTVGSSTIYSGDVLCQKGVVVVTINYRLGPLGFLTTGDAAAPGNFGLLDQIMALQWVKDNIAAFHGNPNKVTIFGESAGAASVSLLLISPLSKVLFHAVIAQSGSSLSPWAVALPYNYPSQPAIARDLGFKMGCQTTDHTAMIACLRTKDAQALVSADVIKDVATQTSWRAVVETCYGFLPDTPLNMLRNGKAHPVPVMKGTNTDEMTGYLRFEVPNIDTGVKKYFFNVLMQENLERFFGVNAAGKIIPRATQVYTEGLNASDPKVLRDAWAQISTDLMYFVGTMGELLLLQTRGPWTAYYQYLFNYRSPFTTQPEWVGVDHAMELSFVFGEPQGSDSSVMDFFYSNHSDMDRKVSDDVMTLWTNFATYGNPTPRAVDGVVWPVFTASARAYLRIESRLTAAFDLRRKRFDFWSQEVPAILAQTSSQPNQNLAC